VEKGRCEPIQPLFGAPIGGDVRWNFAENFGIGKLGSLGYHTAFLVWS